MQGWPIEVGLVMAGFVLLAKGAGWLVDGAAALARRWGISPLMVGLTVVAWGTSLPEVVVSGLASWEGRPGASLGNVLGSNVANIGLVLGVSALILPAILRGRPHGREIFWLLASIGALWAVCADHSVTRPEAAFLLAIFGFYTLLLYRSSRGVPEEMAEEELQEQVHERHLFWILLGSGAIAGGAKLVMLGAEGLAVRAGISDTVIGLTIFALGTSLPELAAGVGSALKGHKDISFGNVIGSNVFNSLAVIGIAGLIAPIDGTQPEVAREISSAVTRDFPLNIAFSLGLIGIPWVLAGRQLRSKAAALILGYLGYIALVCLL